MNETNFGEEVYEENNIFSPCKNSSFLSNNSASNRRVSGNCRSKEQRLIRRELRNNIDENEDFTRARTPPNIKLRSSDHTDLLDEEE